METSRNGKKLEKEIHIQKAITKTQQKYKYDTYLENYDKNLKQHINGI